MSFLVQNNICLLWVYIGDSSSLKVLICISFIRSFCFLSLESSLSNIDSIFDLLQFLIWFQPCKNPYFFRDLCALSILAQQKSSIFARVSKVKIRIKLRAKSYLRCYTFWWPWEICIRLKMATIPNIVVCLKKCCSSKNLGGANRRSLAIFAS